MLDSAAPPGSVPPPGSAADARNDLPHGIVRTAGVRLQRLIGEIVVDLGYATRERVESAVESARRHGRPTGEVLVGEGVLTADQLARVLAERFGVDYVDLSEFRVDQAAIHLVPAETARSFESLPVGFLPDGTLLLATADPANVVVRDDIAMLTQRPVHPLVASRDELVALIAKVARLDEVAEAHESGPVETGPEEILLGDGREADDAPVVKLVHSIVAEAIEVGASDVHFTPEGREMRVHYRIDGVLAPSSTIPGGLVRGVVSRLKIMAALDISERRRPQDGRLTMELGTRSVDVRVVTLPLVEGEAAVLRILDHGGGVIDLAGLGLIEHDERRLRAALAQPYGAVLVTGPTGSGKTTTLYGALGTLNTIERSILTIEDPVEYRIDGIRQMQVNERAGVTFAAGLRSMVRADPDVIMVGEIRDRETAQIAIEAALTGHLLLSTLHTRDAATAIPRLIDMGIEPFLVASAVDCVVAQRLARTLCANCKEQVELSPELLLEAGFDADEPLFCFGPRGCGRCGGTGYRGRVALFEVMAVSEEIRSLVMRSASGDAIAEAAATNGMRCLRDDGLDKVRAGLTSLAEVARVAGSQ